jgi:hypothetical protein
MHFVKTLWRLGLLMLFASATHAEGLQLDPWTSGDTHRQAAVTALLVVDWAQTRWVVNYNKSRDCGYDEPCITHRETNGFLGAHPSMTKVNRYFTASIIGHAAISYVLPKDWREAWQYIWIGIEVDVIKQNHSVGVKMQF